MKKDLKTIILTKQELQIMKVVWDLGSASVKQVCEAISQKKPTAYTTILTLMGILEEKGVLVHERSGRAYIYKPLLSRQQATQNHIKDLLERFFDGSPEKLIRNLLENEIMAPEQISSTLSILESRPQDSVAC